MTQHQGHGKAHHNHSRHIEQFKRKFLISLLLTIPILLLSEMIQNWFGFIIHIPFQKEVLFVLSLVVYLYGGWPFLKGMMHAARAGVEAKHHG